MAMNAATGKWLYGSLFCLALPALLVLWARTAEPNIGPAPGGETWTFAAWAAGAAGIVLVLAGMGGLKKFGNGLPMNAFPPERFVTQGVYRFFRHPIYIGFCLLCGSISILAGSAAGFFLITPVMILLCAALVAGYEQSAIEARFGKPVFTPFFTPPPALDLPASFSRKLCAAVIVFVPWLLLYELLLYTGESSKLISTVLPFEKKLPVIEWTEFFYLLTYPFVALAPFFLRTQRQLRTFVLAGWWTIAAGIFLQFVLPFASPPREFIPQTFFGKLILWERAYDGPAAAFPSFHVMWAFFAAVIFSSSFPKLRVFFFSAAVLIALSCVTTGAHSIADVLAGAAIMPLVFHRLQPWKNMQRVSEKLANSWREWRYGGFRVISHSLYAGLAGVTGILIVGQFTGSIPALLLITGCSLAGAALWGQFIEGSPRLLRPFGYYGSIIGGVGGAFLAQYFFHVPALTIAGAVALAAPWVQAVGRLRCLVQGCCHGKIAENGDGIRYVHEKSRVCHISGLKGQPLHNTQLYSILLNAAAGLVLFRLWYGGASAGMLAGMYLILNGASRFVEEHFRGEVQTKTVGGLRLYQWAAVLSIISGAALTTLQVNAPLALQPVSQAYLLLAALGAGLLSAFAMGMDFPGSNVRFSRLSG